MNAFYFFYVRIKYNSLYLQGKNVLNCLTNKTYLINKQ